jgi:hypothetical protein
MPRSSPLRSAALLRLIFVGQRDAEQLASDPAGAQIEHEVGHRDPLLVRQSAGGPVIGPASPFRSRGGEDAPVSSGT